MTPFFTRAQCDHFAQHADAVSEEIDLAPFGVVPAHGNFANAQPGALREEEQLDVEGEPIHACRLEDRSANVEAKRFESTLRVPEGQTSRNAHEQIENAPGVLPPPRLMDADELAIERA